MPDDNKIELSGSGVKVSYLRFLANGAAGLVIILLLLIGYYFNVPFDLHDHGEKIGREVKAFILLVSLALAIPLGLVVNALGWFLLGGLQRRGAAFWFCHHKSLLTCATSDGYSFELTRDAFDCLPETFYKKAKFYEGVLSAFHSFEGHSASASGIKEFSRSMIIILFVAYLVVVSSLHWWHYWWHHFFIILVIALLGILITLLEFYERAGVLERAYVLTLEEDELNGLSEKEQKRLKCLIKGGLTGRSSSERVTT